MSDARAPEQEPDRVALRPIAIVVAVALAVFGASVVVAAMVTPAPRRETPLPARREIGGIAQTPIAGPAVAQVAREHADAALQELRIVDADAGIAHIPIDVAKQLVIDEGAR